MPFTTLVISVRDPLAKECLVEPTKYSALPSGKLVGVDRREVPMKPTTLAELAALQGVRPIESIEELAFDLWTDEELDAFLRSLNRGDGGYGRS